MLVLANKNASCLNVPDPSNNATKAAKFPEILAIMAILAILAIPLPRPYWYFLTTF